jgi:hypothetical protein
MAVAVDSIDTTAVEGAGSVTSLTLSTLTVGSGSNRALLVVIGTNNNGETGMTVHWDSGGTNQAMTLIGSVADAATSSKLYLWGLVNPTSGNKTLSASWTTACQAIIGAACFTGVDQTGGSTSFAHVNASQGTPASTASQTVTSAVGDYTVGAFSDGGVSSWSAGNHTQWYTDAGNMSDNYLAMTATGAATVTYSATGNAATAYAFVGCDIVAAAGGAAAQVPYQPVYQSGPIMAQ